MYVRDAAVEKQFKRAAHTSQTQSKLVSPKFVIDAENLREKDRRAIWKVVVDKYR